jgi:hypothetical protein
MPPDERGAENVGNYSADVTSSLPFATIDRFYMRPPDEISL